MTWWELVNSTYHHWDTNQNYRSGFAYRLVPTSLIPYVVLFLIDVVVGSVRIKQKISSLRRLHYCCWWLLVKKYFLHKFVRILRSIIWNNMARRLLIFNVLSVFGYYKEFTFVISKKYYKDNSVNRRIYHTVN